MGIDSNLNYNHDEEISLSDSKGRWCCEASAHQNLSHHAKEQRR